MFFHVSQTWLNCCFTFNNNRIHMSTENFCNRHLKTFVRRFTKIDQSTVLKIKRKSIEFVFILFILIEEELNELSSIKMLNEVDLMQQRNQLFQLYELKYQRKKRIQLKKEMIEMRQTFVPNSFIIDNQMISNDKLIMTIIW